jgi:hypothetical protein
VDIGLVTDVPDDLVVGAVKNTVQRQRQLGGAEVRREVPAGRADGSDQPLADLFRQPLGFFARQLLEVVGPVDIIENRHTCFF